MQPIVLLNIGGEEHHFHFNNYALIELGKIAGEMLDSKNEDGSKNTDPVNATQVLNEVIQQNFLLGISIILHCGLVGYKYSKFQLKHGYSVEWCAGHVANADMNQWTPMWDAYKSATGMADFLKDQEAPEPNKKKEPSKRSSSLPSAKSA